jgi:hypothetical protein
MTTDGHVAGPTDVTLVVAGCSHPPPWPVGMNVNKFLTHGGLFSERFFFESFQALEYTNWPQPDRSIVEEITREGIAGVAYT